MARLLLELLGQKPLANTTLDSEHFGNQPNGRLSS